MSERPANPGPSSRVPSGRLNPRETIEACRSIALQLLAADGSALTPWLAADILDLSLGGVCLLLSDDGSLPLQQGMALRLDLRAQPDFQVAQLGASLRWFVPSGYVATLGVHFDQPLGRLPVLV
jgi:c-di-GMP-binding flagellar brake protein YcgR